MAKRTPSSLVLRAALWILMLVGMVGIVSLLVGSNLAGERERGRSQTMLVELLNTVERSTSIACFLVDRGLANEVAEGLLSNRIVEKVAIYADMKLLASAERGQLGGLSPTIADLTQSRSVLIRDVYSPFDPTERVGRIYLVPDRAAIARSASEASWFIGALLSVQVIAVDLAVLAVVYWFITRPMTAIALHLRRLAVERGDKLSHIPGHENDELGELVNYINRLIDRLLRLLKEERRLGLEREIEERKLRSIFEHAATGIFLLDRHGSLLSCNPAFHEILSEVVANTHSARFNIPVLFENDDSRVRDLIDACDSSERPVQRDLKLKTVDGSSICWLHLTLSRIEDDLYQGVINDITDRKKAEQRALAVAMTDPLTKVLNRRGFEKKLQSRVKRRQRSSDTGLALMLVDLDLFKQVNDTYGHDAGDMVLVAAASVLKRLVRRTDLVGRLGGDEFVVLLGSFSSVRSLELIARKIIQRIGQPIDIGDGRLAFVGASVGVSVCRYSQLDYDQLLKQADEAMYRAKKAGRNTFHIMKGAAGTLRKT